MKSFLVVDLCARLDAPLGLLFFAVAEPVGIIACFHDVAVMREPVVEEGKCGSPAICVTARLEVLNHAIGTSFREDGSRCYWHSGSYAWHLAQVAAAGAAVP